MPNQYSYRKEYADKLFAMTNRELLDEVYAVNKPDEYDGSFSTEAAWQLDAACDELERRLTLIGWLC
jgi:hypothetical protein